MPGYLLQVAYSAEALAGLIADPQNRADVVRTSIENLGGNVVGSWMSFGEYDLVVVIEMPNNVAAAASALAVAGGGSVKTVKTTPLLSLEEGVAALKKASTSGYKPVTPAN